MEFKALYLKVRGIVYKTRKEFYIKGWEKEDWDQEGMLALYQLIQTCPEAIEDEEKLYKYFKVKFRNYILDMVRKQESQKRKFDKMAYEEISALSHSIGEKGLVSDERVILNTMLEEYKSGLNPSDRSLYQRLLRGERFKGRQKLLVDLRTYLSDFNNSI